MKKLWELAKELSVIVFFAFLVWFLYKTTINEGKGFFLTVFGLTCLVLVFDILGAASSALKEEHYKSVIGGLLENKGVIMSPWFHAAFAAVFVLGIISLFVISGRQVSTAYDNGHDDGYRAGYEDGKNLQYEEDCENMLIDGVSIRDVSETIQSMYDMSPSMAYDTVYCYKTEPDHGGYTLAEYQEAIEAILTTASMIDFT